jgi:hypothetical protein
MAFHINLSNPGVGQCLGMRGTRSTVGIPGSRVPYTTESTASVGLPRVFAELLMLALAVGSWLVYW